MSLIAPQFKTFTIHQEGTSVQIIVNGTLVMDLPWDGALELAKAIHVVAKRAEEGAKAEQVIADQALAMRSGWPFGGFTGNPAMIREAGKLAAWDSNLRRYLPHREVNGELYPFTVTQKPPER